MSKNTVISVENISKCYRIGMMEQADSLVDAVGSWIRYPFRSFRDLRKLTHFSDSEASDVLWALKDISFEVQQGEVLGIIGKNGAGKSTLLKILSRITTPSSGRIVIHGRVNSLLEVGTGFHPELTGRDNVFLNGTILGMSRKEVAAKFDSIVDFSGVEKFIDTPVKRYSSGMKVRLAFAVAAHLEPEILIIDEVLAVGDYEFQKKCLGKMGEVAKGGRTVLFVSHNMQAVTSLCPKAVLLVDGRIVKSGKSSDIISYYLGENATHFNYQSAFGYDSNKEAQIRSISLANIDESGNRHLNHQHIDLNGRMAIRIKYELRSVFKGLSVGVSVFPVDHNVRLLASNDVELNPERLMERPKGRYSAELVIPAKLLNTGVYRLRVGIVASKQILDVADDIFFRVVDPVGINMHTGFSRKNALLSMQLPWQVAPEDNPDSPSL